MSSLQSIGNYDIIEPISSSGATAVYLGRHKKLKRKTLLKVYSGGDPALIDRFEREARIVADLDSELIVSIYDFGKEGNYFYISMEYVDGHNLEVYLKEHELSEEQIIDFALQISDCTAVLHKKGYIHRDLKPENILVDKQQKIKLTDFGLSFHDAANRVTSDGDLLGTPFYMSPEQINNKTLTFSSDVFSLGIIFYQMAAGIHPFEAAKVGEIFSRILSANPAPVKSVRPSLPKWFSRLIEHLLEKEAGRRVQDAAEISRIIRSHIGEEIVEISNQPPLVPADNKTRPARIVIPALIVIVFVGLFFLKDWISNTFYNSADSLSNHSSGVISADSASNGVITSKFRDSLNYFTANRDSIIHMVEHDSVISNQTESPQKHPTTMLIKTYPWCDIYLNYQHIDTGPMIKPLNIKPGNYILGLQNPEYPSYLDSIKIIANKSNELEYNLDSIFSRLELQVQPWGDIFIDGKYIGQTPLQKPLYVTRGKHILKIKNEFYKTWTDTIVCEGKTELIKLITLAKIE